MVFGSFFEEKRKRSRVHRKQDARIKHREDGVVLVTGERKRKGHDIQNWEKIIGGNRHVMSRRKSGGNECAEYGKTLGNLGKHVCTQYTCVQKGVKYLKS